MKYQKVIIQPLTRASSGRLLAPASLIVEQRYAINSLRIVRSSSSKLDGIRNARPLTATAPHRTPVRICANERRLTASKSEMPS